jgi:energy-coupling factor transport system substrate-specific component
MGMMFPLFFMRDAYFAHLRPVYGDEYADAVLALTPPWAFFALIGLTFLGGILGGFLGKSVLEKHFVRAGLV